MNDRPGPGVVPRRYAGKAIRLHGGPTPQQVGPSGGEGAGGRVRARLPKDEAALPISAIDTAKDQFGPPPARPDPSGDVEHEPAPGVEVYSNADALVDMARGFLDTAPQDRSGKDRTLVVVHVSAENVAGNVPAGMQRVPAEADESTSDREDPVGTVPAGMAPPGCGVSRRGCRIG